MHNAVNAVVEYCISSAVALGSEPLDSLEYPQRTEQGQSDPLGVAILWNPRPTPLDRGMGRLDRGMGRLDREMGRLDRDETA